MRPQRGLYGLQRTVLRIALRNGRAARWGSTGPPARSEASCTAVISWRTATGSGMRASSFRLSVQSRKARRSGKTGRVRKAGSAGIRGAASSGKAGATWLGSSRGQGRRVRGRPRKVHR